MNIAHDLFHVMNVYLIMYCVYIIINVIPMYHQGEDPTLEPLGSNPYTIRRHGHIHANNPERAKFKSIFGLHSYDIKKHLVNMMKYMKNVHMFQKPIHMMMIFFLKVKKPLMKGWRCY